MAFSLSPHPPFPIIPSFFLQFISNTSCSEMLNSVFSHATSFSAYIHPLFLFLFHPPLHISSLTPWLSICLYLAPHIHAPLTSSVTSWTSLSSSPSWLLYIVSQQTPPSDSLKNSSSASWREHCFRQVCYCLPGKEVVSNWMEKGVG